MNIYDHYGEIEIKGISDFDPMKTFECGQCFRWNAADDGVYTGVAFGRVARVRRIGESIFISGSMEDFNAIWRDYFDIDRDYAKIRKRLEIDDFMRQATAYGEGIRILRQDKWEALCSFIISQNNNIPRIKKIVNSLCRHFGEKITSTDGEVYYSFPSAEKLAALNIEDMAPLRCGYRAEYIINAAKMITAGIIDLDELSRSSPLTARSTLKSLKGIGDKVADCVLLFGLNMLDSFPLDVWMKRAIAEHYGPDFDPVVFHPYAGIAQQYIFYSFRNGAGGHTLQ